MASCGSAGFGQHKHCVIVHEEKSYHMFDLSLEVLRVVETRPSRRRDNYAHGRSGWVRLMRRWNPLSTVARYDDRSPAQSVIGEGERDQGADAVYIGEKVGAAQELADGEHMTVDIARGCRWRARNLCCTGGAGGHHGAGGGGIRRVAATRRIVTWKRSSWGPAAKGAVDLDAPVRQNLKSIARRLQRGVDDLVVVVLDGRDTTS